MKTFYKYFAINVSRLAGLIRNINIHKRLVGSFFLLPFIPLLITGTLSYYKSSSAIKSKISTYSVQVVEQVSKNIQRELDIFNNISVDISFLDTVQDTLISYKSMSEWAKINISFQLNNIIGKKLAFSKDISDILIYTNEKEKISAYDNNYLYQLNLKEEYLDMLLKTASEKKGAVVWSPINSDYEVRTLKTFVNSEDRRNAILLSRQIRALSDGRPIGSLIMKVKETSFANVYKDIDIGKDADIFIVNSEGVIISSRNTEVEVGKQYKDLSLIEKIGEEQKKGMHVFRKTIGKIDYLVAYSMLQNNNWYVVSLIPYSYLDAETKNIRSYTILIGILCFFFAEVLSQVISRSISVPLMELNKTMKKAMKGNLSVSIVDNNKDEIAEVTSEFNNMLVELQTLVQNVKSEEKQKRIAQFKALQAQINPHFLSNTLNNVRWLARMQNAGNIEDLTTNLIQLLHLSMGKGGELISVREEIEYLKNYISIEEYRYFDKFKVHFDIQEEVYDLFILKFLLQPILENSLIHGIEPMQGQGLILIKAYLEAGNLKISVTDNGVGMYADTMNRVLKGDMNTSNTKFNGIGVSNLNERIKLYFGDMYGIHIESIPDLYTTVEIVFPIVEEKGD
jgi:two-component system, sensor histidine kinase YesM